jgi:Uma2 family endonuclease
MAVTRDTFTIGDDLSMATASTRSRSPRPAPRPAAPPLGGVTTVGELLKVLGNIPAHRVRLCPAPGTATERDLIRILDEENRPCELVDGTLVEKAMGFEESDIAMLLGTFLNIFVRPRKLGIVTGSDGTVRLFPGLVRIPDVAFTSWETLPGRKYPKDPIPHLAPDLVVEVLSKSNTKAEMARKLEEYFRAGVKLAWLVDPKTRTVRVHTSAAEFVVVQERQTLSGGMVLPGFTLALRELFPRRGR